MGFALYNEIAHEYNKTMEAQEERELAQLKAQDLDPSDYLEAEYQIWKRLDNQKPQGWQCWDCTSRVERWLSEEIEDFQFPAEGLCDSQKTALIQKINQLILKVGTTDFQTSEQLINLSCFLDKNDKIFNY